MNNLIDYTYFKGELNIPNLSVTGGVGTALQSELNEYIAEYQQQYLRRLLGDDLYEAFETGLASVTPAARWVTLRSQLIDSTNKRSPIAQYVYFCYQNSKHTVVTGSGDKTIGEGNLQPQYPSWKMTQVFNNCVRASEKIYDWIETNKASYPEWEENCFDFDRINSLGI